MPNIAITGAGSGCGRGFVEAFSRNPSNTIFAIDRAFKFTVTSTPIVCNNTRCYGSIHPLYDKNEPRCGPNNFFQKNTESKQDIDKPRNHGRIINYEADLSSETGVASLSTWLSSYGVIFDIVIHCAGVRGLASGLQISDQASIATAESLTSIDASTMMHTFSSNALASFLFLRAILRFCRRCSACARTGRGPSHDSKDQVKAGGGGNTCSACLDLDITATKILVLGSRRGSMTGSSALGGCYAYRASKAAQHAIVRSLATDAPDIIWLLCHPGCVDTGLVPVREDGAISVEESVTDMMRLLEGVKMRDSGRLVDRWGEDIPW